jgi:hypothetical protein
MLVTVATREACTHEDGLCPPDNLTEATAAPGGGREGACPPPAKRPHRMWGEDDTKREQNGD